MAMAIGSFQYSSFIHWSVLLAGYSSFHPVGQAVKVQ
jgi:hypothetical protein